MIAILSATEHDFYAMPLPFAVYSWHKLGAKCIVFHPKGDNPKIELAKEYCGTMATFFEFSCEEKRIPTYSQVVRLFGAAIPLINDDEDVITADGDMCVFDGLNNLLNDMEYMQVIGADLTPQDQYPICFIKMKAYQWRNILGITKTYQEHVSELIDPIQGLNIRGEQWNFDQWYIKKKVIESGAETCVDFVKRSNGYNQFATHRADRDGWNFDAEELVDAHLPRPLTDDENFKKVYDLFITKYPNEDFTWLVEYTQEYKKLINE